MEVQLSDSYFHAGMNPIGKLKTKLKGLDGYFKGRGTTRWNLHCDC
jgi:hypothetical protein